MVYLQYMVLKLKCVKSINTFMFEYIPVLLNIFVETDFFFLESFITIQNYLLSLLIYVMDPC